MRCAAAATAVGARFPATPSRRIRVYKRRLRDIFRSFCSFAPSRRNEEKRVESRGFQSWEGVGHADEEI